MRVLTSCQKNIAMFWTPKAGCSTAVNIFLDYVGFEYSSYEWIHEARMLYEKTQCKYSDSLVKFQIVRNPYDRAVSSFLECTRWKNKQSGKPYGLKEMTELFVEFLNSVKRNELKDSCKFHSLRQYMTPNLDMVLKLENLEKEISLLNQKFGLSLRYFYYNRHSFRNSLGNLYEDVYSKIYNQDSLKLVEEIYSKDFEFFGYSTNR